MAIAPYNCNARVVFSLNVGSLTHQIHIATNTDAPIGGGSSVAIYGGYGDTLPINFDTFADLFWSLVRPLYGAADSCASAVLEKKLTTGWGLVGSHAVASPAGSGSIHFLTGVTTCSFKAADNTYVKIALPESNLTPPQRGSINPVGSGPIDPLAASLLAPPGGGELADGWASRSNAPVISCSTFFTTISKRTRRRRGYL